MYIKLTIWQLPSPSVWSIQAELYDSDWVKTMDLEMNSVVIDLLQELHIEVKNWALYLPDTHDS